MRAGHRLDPHARARGWHGSRPGRADDRGVHAVGDLVGRGDGDAGEPGRGSGRRGTRRRRAPRRCSRPGRRAAIRWAGVRSSSARMSQMPSRPPGRRTRKHSANTAGRSVDRLITQLEMITSTEPSGSGIASIWPRRNSAFCAPACARVGPGQVQHLLGHVQAVRLPGRADPAGRQQHVDAAAGAQVQHRLPGMQVRHRDRVAAAEAGPHRAVGQAAGVRVPGRAEAARRERARVAVGDRLARLRGPGEAAVPGR